MCWAGRGLGRWKHLLWKREDPSSNPRYSHEKLGMVLCDHNVSGQRQGGSLGLAGLQSGSGFHERLDSQRNQVVSNGAGCWTSFSSMCRHAHVCTHLACKYTCVKKGVAVFFVEENNKEKSLLDAQFSSFILKTLSNWNQSATWCEISISVGFVLLQGRVSSEIAS